MAFFTLSENRYCFLVAIATVTSKIFVWNFFPMKFYDRQCHGMRTFNVNQIKEQPGARDEENGEKPKIQITKSVEIGNHSTVFLVGESLNLKPRCDQILCTVRWEQ